MEYVDHNGEVKWYKGGDMIPTGQTDSDNSAKKRFIYFEPPFVAKSIKMHVTQEMRNHDSTQGRFDVLLAAKTHEELKGDSSAEAEKAKKAIKALNEERQKQFDKSLSLYNERTIQRLIGLVQMFTLISREKQKALKMMRHIATPNFLAHLIELLVIGSPRLQISIVKIIENLLRIELPNQVF